MENKIKKKKKKRKKINSQICATQILAIGYHRLSDPISLNNHVFEYTWLHTSPSLSPLPGSPPAIVYFPVQISTRHEMKRN